MNAGRESTLGQGNLQADASPSISITLASSVVLSIGCFLLFHDLRSLKRKRLLPTVATDTGHSFVRAREKGSLGFRDATVSSNGAFAVTALGTKPNKRLGQFIADHQTRYFLECIKNTLSNLRNRNPQSLVVTCLL